jgi:hypothetical protein
MTKTATRTGRVGERPHAYLHLYVAVTRKLGLLAGIIVGYIEYLERTEVPDHVDEQRIYYYRLPLQDMRHDLSLLSHTPVDRVRMQTRLRALSSRGVLKRIRFNKNTGDQTWYYGLDKVKLVSYLQSQVEEEEIDEQEL